MSKELLNDDRMERLFDAGLFGKWLVNMDVIKNIADLTSEVPHGIIRCNGPVNDAVRFIPVETMGLEGCIAGWISEEE